MSAQLHECTGASVQVCTGARVWCGYIVSLLHKQKTPRVWELFTGSRAHVHTCTSAHVNTCTSAQVNTGWIPAGSADRNPDWLPAENCCLHLNRDEDEVDRHPHHDGDDQQSQHEFRDLPRHKTSPRSGGALLQPQRRSISLYRAHGIVSSMMLVIE